MIPEAEPQSSVIERARAGAGARRAAIVAVAIIAVAAIVLFTRPSEVVVTPLPTPSPAASATTQIPDDLLHSWQRPYAVTPGLDQWGSGFLVLTRQTLDYRPEPDAQASRAAVAVAVGGRNTLVVTATVETQGCAPGAVGTYRWLLEGTGTVMTLTSIGPDACTTRQEALAGQWVRSDLPANGFGEALLAPGTYLSTAFEPFDEPAVAGRLSYSVPEGWTLIEDGSTTLVLHHPRTATFVALFAQPRVAAYESGASCGPVGEAPGIGDGVDDIVAAIVVRPGVVSTSPAGVTIGAYDGQLLDLHLSPSWTDGCQSPEGLIVGLPILVEAGFANGPVAGIAPDHPIRVILLDLEDGRSMAIIVFNPETSPPTPFEEQVAAAMPIIESFQFHGPTR